MSLFDAAQSGNRLKILIATRDYLAARLDDGVEAKSVAPIAKELRETILEIDQIPQPRKGAIADDISKRRAERFAKSSTRANT